MPGENGPVGGSAPSPAGLPFEEFLKICSESGLLDEDRAGILLGFARAMGGVGHVPRLAGSDSHRLQSFENILSFDYPDHMTFDSYVTTDENYYTCEILRTVAFIPRIWKTITPVFIHAPTGQGKTHLLAATRNATSRKRALLLNSLDLETEFQHSRSADKERELRDWLASHDLLLLDDIQFAAGNTAFQKFVISVMHHMPRDTHGVVVSSDVEPSRMTRMIPSLLSRLMSGITIKLEIVDRKGRMEILEQFFRYSGLHPGGEVIDYLADTFTDNVRQLKAAARMVLAHMLGSGMQVSMEAVRNLLGFMTDGVHAPQEHPPEPERTEYIVVEMDEEPAPPTGEGTEPEGDEEEPAPGGSPPHPEEPGELPPPTASGAIVVPALETESSPPSSVVELERQVVRKVEVSERKVIRKGTARKYKEMVESADTVEKQTEALRLAVVERIRQLTESGGDRAEVGRLQVALRFLEKGDLEAAIVSLKV